MFHHLTTSLTLLTLGWAHDDPPGPRRTTRQRRSRMAAAVRAFPLREPGTTDLARPTRPR